MTRERLYLFDTTLRDGAQTTGVDFSLEDKRLIIRTLDELGLDYIEGGYPGANVTDTELFSTEPSLKNATLTAFGMTKRAGRSVSNDPGFQAILQAKAGAICLVAKAWDYHVRVALGISNDENLAGVAQSVRGRRQGRPRSQGGAGREAMIDCEHFFDGYKANRDYALAVATTAYKSGARWVVLCDTNGGTLPHEVSEIVAEVAKHVPGSHLGIHTHNDTENAVANTLAAVRAGARQIQGTLNGLGERCGNANLTSLIPTLLLKTEFAERFEVKVGPEQLRKLTHASRVLDEILNRAPNRQAPYVGEAAFATKAGIHASRHPEGAGHLRARGAGKRRQPPPRAGLRPGRQVEPAVRAGAAGRAGRARRSARGATARRGEGARGDGLCLRGRGRVLRAAGAAAARHGAGVLPREGFRVDGREPPQFELGKLITVSEATVKAVHRRRRGAVWSVAEGNGPVNALDQALRKDLGRYQGIIKDVELVDYKVRILTGGTEAVTRVLVESRDKATGERWFTVGVSPNIVDASFEALIDSITYKLLRAGAAA